MININEVSPEQIERLSDLQLTKLLRKLLYLEAFKNNLPTSGVSVPLNITVGDGGEDGRIQWSDGLEKTNWIPNRFTLFQIKATEMEPKICKSEIFRSEKTLKPKVEEVFDNTGCYILFHNFSLNKKQIDDRISKIREGLNEASKTYHDTALIDVFDAHKITAWVNEYPSAVVFVLECLNIIRDKIFKTWEKWESYYVEDFSYEFVQTSTIDDYLKTIDEIAKKNQGILRIVGLSGLGKTRLVLESFRAPDKIDLFKTFLNYCVLYCDASDIEWPYLKASVASLCEQESKGILIVDNCDLSLHKKLKKELRGSKITLITLYFDPEDIDEDSPDPYIILEPNKFDDLIPKLLMEIFPGIEAPDISRIQEFSQGFPLMTVLLGRGKTDGSPNLGKLNDKELIERLLGINDEEPEIKKILCACSIFDSFGYELELESNRNFIASFISKLTGTEKEKKDKFYEVCERYLRRGILEKKGRRIFLKPKPLALTLAAEWWQGCRPESVPSILESIKNEGLTDPLCSQMAKLDFLPKARDLTESLCGKQGPFGQAEVLNTEEGSRIFRALVELNPQATVNALERAFGSFSKEQLLEVKAGRRNLVWALEKLCFRKETFTLAVKILLSFAVAENETWGNNATNQFIQLFLVVLAGTEADLQTRLDILKEITEKGIDDELKIAIKAFKAGLTTLHISRRIGAENQGSSAPLQDYKPKNGEILYYQSEILNLLYKVTIQYPLVSDLANSVIVASIRDMAHIGNFSIMELILSEIIKQKNCYWPEALDELTKTLNFEKNLNDSDKLIINNLITSLSPKNIDNILRLTITKPLPDWNMRKDEKGNYINSLQINAEKLATDFSNKPDLFTYLKIIYEGEQSLAFNFSKKLGELSEPSFAQDYIENSLNVLKEIEPGKRSYDAIAGFLFGNKDQEFIKNTLDLIISESDLKDGVFYIFSKVAPDLTTLLKLFPLIESKELPIKSFIYLRWGDAFYSLKPDEVLILVKKLASYSLEGVWVSITLLYDSLQNNPKYLSTYQSFIEEISLKEDLLFESLKIDHTIVSHSAWENLVFRLLKAKPETKILLTENIIRFLKINYKFGAFTGEIKELINYLFDNYFDEVWPAFGQSLLEQDSPIFLIQKQILGADNGISIKTEGILFKPKNYDSLINWCSNNLPDSARYIASMMPVYKIKEQIELPESHLKRMVIDEEEPLHPFAENFIDRFGNDELVLSEFSAQLGSYGYEGSGIPMLNNQKKIFEKLEKHSLINVREWARKELIELNDTFKQTKIFEDEMFM